MSFVCFLNWFVQLGQNSFRVILVATLRILLQEVILYLRIMGNINSGLLPIHLRWQRNSPFSTLRCLKRTYIFFLAKITPKTLIKTCPEESRIIRRIFNGFAQLEVFINGHIQEDVTLFYYKNYQSISPGIMQMTLLVTFRQMKKTKDLAKFILTFEFSQLMMNLKYLT